jgi:hypothetical protein
MPSGVYKRNFDMKIYRSNRGTFALKYLPIKIGERIGLWSVLERGSFKHNQQRWLCRCECGIEREIAQQHLRTGKSTRCKLCSGKERSRKAQERNLGRYQTNSRTLHVMLARETLYKSQNGICPICGKQLPSLDKCAWDHDHETGEGRALLHRGCNVFLGFIERDSEIVNRATQYCTRYKIEIKNSCK